MNEWHSRSTTTIACIIAEEQVISCNGCIFLIVNEPVGTQLPAASQEWPGNGEEHKKITAPKTNQSRTRSAFSL